jgi:PAS domain-containing protein
VSLFRQDGVRLARYPHVEPSVAQSLSIDARYRKLLATGARSELVRFTDAADGQDKLLAIRLLDNYPLGINVEMTVDQALTNWRQLAIYIAGAAAFLELVICAIALLMGRQLRNQRLLVEADGARTHAETELTLSREREAAHLQAGVQDSRLSAALDSMSHGLGLFDAENCLVRANAKCETMLGIAPGSDIGGLHLADLLDVAVARGVVDAATASSMLTRILADIASGERASFVQDFQNGKCLSVHFSPVASGGWLVTFEDITERRQADARVTHMAHHDALTGLANRALFRDRWKMPWRCPAAIKSRRYIASTSTDSRSSTIPSATPWAMRSCTPSPRACWRRSERPTPLPGSVATNSPSSRPASTRRSTRQTYPAV